MTALILFCLLLAPTYVLRFSIARYPTNLLMVWVFFVWVIFLGLVLVKKTTTDFIQFIRSLDKQLLVLIGLFFIAGVISLFHGGIDRNKLGQFLVLFLQPISLFFISGFILRQNPRAKSLLLDSCYLILALCGLFAILQYFTRLGLPMEYWGNTNEPKRALSFFVHPNFYALFSAPLLAFLIPDLVLNLKSSILNLKLLSWLLGAIGLFLSLSRGGWLGLAAAASVYLLVAADKKIRRAALSAAVVIFIIILIVPNFRYRLLLPFYGEKSTVSRFSLLHTGWKMVRDEPILGKGLMGFDRNFNAYNTDPGLGHLDFAHNIFLNFWIDTGLLGLLSFLGILFYGIKKGLSANRAWAPSPPLGEMPQFDWDREGAVTKVFQLGFSLFCIALLFHGLIDVPYLKNDLALIFWIILSASL